MCPPLEPLHLSSRFVLLCRSDSSCLPCSLSIYLYSLSLSLLSWLQILASPSSSALASGLQLLTSSSPLTSPWRVGRGEGADRALVPPTSVWAGHHLLVGAGGPGPQNRQPEAPDSQGATRPSHLKWVCSRAGGQVLLSAP